jgi:hypothetical protein
VDVLARQSELVAEQVFRRAHHAFKAAHVSVKLGVRAEGAELSHQVGGVVLHVASAARPFARGAREGDLVAKVRVVAGPALELVLIENVLLEAGAEEEP